LELDIKRYPSLPHFEVDPAQDDLLSHHVEVHFLLLAFSKRIGCLSPLKSFL
jgi:hypothetical protein